MRIFTFDSTLHDGTQADRVSFGVEDKLLILRRLDEFGVDYIDGGWASDPHDREFFARARQVPLQRARLVASGSTANVPHLLGAGTPVVCFMAESWDLHVFRTLGATTEEHLHSIAHSIRGLKAAGREVIYNAEHFFDAWESNPTFALSTLQAAADGGADVICLCDSNGGTLPSRLGEICREVRAHIGGILGIHAHNDADLAVANTLTAVEHGFAHVQGCMNGYGERCGCANLCSIIPNLELKAGHITVGRDRLEKLNGLAHFIAEHANLALPAEQPYVGPAAFTIGTDHTRPEYVGSTGRTGDLNFRLMTDPLARHLSKDKRRELTDAVHEKEHEGYELAGADGTFELLLRETLAPGMRFFNTLNYEVDTRMTAGQPIQTSASVAIEVDDSVLTATAHGQGPVHALDLALRQCLLTVYPAIGDVRLVDYKVRVLDAHKGSASKVRVLIEWSDGSREWSTAGVSDNIIEASWLALTGAVRLELLRLHASEHSPAPAEDYSWAV